MYRRIRITVASLATILLCLAGSSMTLSYFTDTQSQENRFVIGNASTSMTIYSDAAGTIPFSAEAHAIVEQDPMPFYLRATNNGNIPVYQRFRIVIPIELADKVALNMSGCTLAPVTNQPTQQSCSLSNYDVLYDSSVKVDNTPTYAEYYITSKDILTVNGATNTTASWPTTNLTFSNISSLTSEQKDTLFGCGNDANNCVLGIKTYSDAIQTAGADSAIEAFGRIGETY